MNQDNKRGRGELWSYLVPTTDWHQSTKEFNLYSDSTQEQIVNYTNYPKNYTVIKKHTLPQIYFILGCIIVVMVIQFLMPLFATTNNIGHVMKFLSTLFIVLPTIIFSLVTWRYISALFHYRSVLKAKTLFQKYQALGKLDNNRNFKLVPLQDTIAIEWDKHHDEVEFYGAWFGLGHKVKSVFQYHVKALNIGSQFNWFNNYNQEEAPIHKLIKACMSSEEIENQFNLISFLNKRVSRYPINTIETLILFNKPYPETEILLGKIEFDESQYQNVQNQAFNTFMREYNTLTLQELEVLNSAYDMLLNNKETNSIVQLLKNNLLFKSQQNQTPLTTIQNQQIDAHLLKY